MKEFKFSIGQEVMQRNHDGDLESTIVLERNRINGNNVYITDLIGKWENEEFIKP